MKFSAFDDAVTLYDLNWDTEFFGIKCGKAILNKPLTLNRWDELKARFNDYQFISIQNQNSEPTNNQLLGKYTTAFLADTNIQFEKHLVGLNEGVNEVSIYQSLDKIPQIIEIAEFPFSKFTEDPELAKRGGDSVYRQWIINSFKKPNKYFALSMDDNGEINGFLLHSYSYNACVIELIAVSNTSAKKGIGTALFKAVEYSAFQNGYHLIKVGTQQRNIKAINFYQKNGCKQVECNQVYHLWNLKTT
jgi:dTDP-4-amino-4,6-dideoxy-D-galactose acyltransferase